ncbi:MAG: recombinase family protein [Ruminococcus sp.]|nr:recombinase family protein [Ruminococcus sp.]
MSTDKQEELSPDAQKRLLLDYAKSHNMLVSPDMIFIENGISGRKADKRPEFQRMIGLAKSSERPFQAILVWKFSRFARNQEESIVYKSMLKKQYSIDVISITEPLIEGPFGSLIERIIEWMDEYYSINLSGEVIRGMTEKAMRGGYQSTPSLGYASPGHGQPFVIVPEEAEIVKYIFHQYVYEHKDFTAIARKLNERKVLTKRGNLFEKRNISYILKNRFYIGKIIWNDIERDGVHETFISKELFQAANERLEAEFRPSRRRNVSVCKHWLSGLIKCSICGSSLSFNGGRDKFFQCWKYAKGFHQGSQYISVNKMENAVLEYLDTLLNGADFSFVYHSPAVEERESELFVYEKELKKLSDRERRIKDAYEAGIDTLEEYKENRQRLQKEREHLTELLNSSKEPSVKDQSNDKNQMLSKIQAVCDILKDVNIDNDMKGTFIRSIVEEIIWNHDDNTLIFRLYMSENP